METAVTAAEWSKPGLTMEQSWQATFWYGQNRLSGGLAAPKTLSQMPCELQNRATAKLSLLGVIIGCFFACAARNNSCRIIPRKEQ